MIYVFHEHQVIEIPEHTWDYIYPVGSYVLEGGNRWYKMVLTSYIPINQCDIPDWVKALCLIGGIAR